MYPWSITISDVYPIPGNVLNGYSTTPLTRMKAVGEGGLGYTDLFWIYLLLKKIKIQKKNIIALISLKNYGTALQVFAPPPDFSNEDDLHSLYDLEAESELLQIFGFYLAWTC